MTTRPEFLVMPEGASRLILQRNHVGRLAFAHASTVDIEPIGYVVSDDWIFFRTAPGTKQDALAHNPWVAFEVDEVTGPFDWVSVVVHGTVYTLAPDAGAVDRRQYARAVGALRSVVPAAFTEGDPTPHRELVYGLHIDRTTGRMART